MMDLFERPIKELLTKSELEVSNNIGIDENITIHDALSKYLDYIHELGYDYVEDIKEENKNKDDLVYYDILTKIYDNLPKY